MEQIQQTLKIDYRSGGKFYLLALLGIIIGLTTAIRAQTEWIKHPSNPVLSHGTSGTWDDVWVMEPTVILDDSTYKMWFQGYGGTGTSYVTGYATSPDGITWTKIDSVNPVLDVGPAGSWDDVKAMNVSVLYDSTSYKMWYNGYDGTTSGIGYATSPDGMNWTKIDSVNPVFGEGSAGAWDDDGVATPVVIFADTSYMLWYSGGDGTNRRIGLATSNDGAHWTKQAGNPVMDIDTGWESREIYPEAVLYNWNNLSDVVLGGGPKL